MATEVTPSPSRKPRRPWLAVLLSLLFWPLGQMYAGSLLRTLLFSLGDVLALLALIVACIGLPVGRRGLWLMVAFFFLYRAAGLLDAYFLARRNRYVPLKWYQRWWIYPVVYVALVAIYNGVAEISRSYIGEAFVIPTRSMNPTLEPGDRIIVDKWLFDPSKVQRDDLIVYYSEGRDSPFFVMRVVGLPGDTIEIIDEVVHINGKEYVDRYALREGPVPEMAPEMVNFGPETIPKDSCFVLGDNRRNARDSRFLGPVPLSDVIAKARLIYWSSERIEDPEDPEHFTRGAIRWGRMGMRLD